VANRSVYRLGQAGVGIRTLELSGWLRPLAGLRPARLTLLDIRGRLSSGKP